MATAGLPLTAAGVAEYYGDLLDGIVADEDVTGRACLRTDTEMGDSGRRAGLARRTLAFARARAGGDQ
jgi:hypothetical protein